MYSITQNGKPLHTSLYTIDEKTKTFSSKEDSLVLDFRNESGWHFITGYDCTVNTGSDCTFDTGMDCTFKTGSNCTFDTGSDCTFDTGNNCTFDTFNKCIFYTGYRCTFKTGSDCIFKTGSACTFDTFSDCTLETGINCVVIRRDVYEVIELKENSKIKLNGYKIKGYVKLTK